MKTLNYFVIITFLFLVSFPRIILGQINQQKRDQQNIEAKKFVHQGIKDRVLKEKCKDINDCEFEEGFSVEKLIGQAYSLLGLIGGGGLTSLNKVPSEEQIKAAAEKSTLDKKVKPEKDKETDYCILTAMTYEAVSTQIQNVLQKQADQTQSAGDAQLQALVSLQETHNARKKTARIQSYIYGAVTGCYTAMLFKPVIAKDANLFLKLSASAALTSLYIKKSNKHKKESEKVGEVIAAMSLAGKDCNPWTRSSCFCKEPTSKEIYPHHFEEVCILNKGNFEGTKVSLGCTASNENKISFDKECKCKATNTCLKSNLQLFGPQFGSGYTLMSDVNKTLDQISLGEFDMGELDRKSIDQAATATKVKIKGSDQIRPPQLSDDQKKMAEELEKYMPKNLAQIAASVKPSSLSSINDLPTHQSAAISKRPQSIKETNAEAISVDYKQGVAPSTYTDEGPDFTMPKINSSDELASSDSAEVLSFSEEATMRAEVSNNPVTPLFDIITNRYRNSAWKKLNPEDL